MIPSGYDLIHNTGLWFMIQFDSQNILNKMWPDLLKHNKLVLGVI